MASKSQKNTKTNTLSVEGVCLSYAKHQALVNITLDIKEGECFGLIGVNGSGKTSFIKTILGLRRQDEGKVILRDDQSVAFLPEKFEPSWFLTGKEFLAFSMSLHKKRYDEDLALKYADHLNLDRKAFERSVRTYSKGMRQKLGLLSVVMSGAKFLVLDEPMSGLDPYVREQVKSLLKAIHKEGRTVLISSHMLGDLEELCDRVALVHKKKIETIDTLSNLLKKTQTQSLEKCFLKLVSV